jgi:hypothetical protein
MPEHLPRCKVCLHREWKTVSPGTDGGAADARMCAVLLTHCPATFPYLLLTMAGLKKNHTTHTRAQPPGTRWPHPRRRTCQPLSSLHLLALKLLGFREKFASENMAPPHPVCVRKPGREEEEIRAWSPVSASTQVWEQKCPKVGTRICSGFCFFFFFFFFGFVALGFDFRASCLLPADGYVWGF